jgi:hypothetical protein
LRAVTCGESALQSKEKAAAAGLHALRRRPNRGKFPSQLRINAASGKLANRRLYRV